MRHASSLTHVELASARPHCRYLCHRRHCGCQRRSTAPCDPPLAESESGGVVGTACARGAGGCHDVAAALGTRRATFSGTQFQDVWPRLNARARAANELTSDEPSENPTWKMHWHPTATNLAYPAAQIWSHAQAGVGLPACEPTSLGLERSY